MFASIKISVILFVIMQLFAAPALSQIPAAEATGTLIGTFKVGKTQASCSSSDPGTTGGAGLGLPVLHSPKSAYFSLDASVAEVQSGPGTLGLCGIVDSPLIVGSAGAACGASSGRSGVGRVWTTQQIDLFDADWEQSVGDTLPIKARLDPSSDYRFFALVQTTISASFECLTKDSRTGPDQKSGGSTGLMAVGTYFIVAP